MPTVRIDTVRKGQRKFIGDKFGRLLVTGIELRVGTKGGPENVVFAVCNCDCGNSYVGRLYALRKGIVVSCGCYQKELVTKHGFAKHKNTEELRLYQIWSGIKQRCLNPKQKFYSRYGGRGITICPLWEKSFDTFFNDMGHRPSKNHSIDRLDNSLGYYKENCRWADRKQQAQNTSSNINFTFGSAQRSLSYWCDLFGVPHATAISRIKLQGMTPQEAVTKPFSDKLIHVGERFGNLVVIELLEFKSWKTSNKHRSILCLCDCGRQYKAVDTRLRFGKTLSCMHCAAKRGRESFLLKANEF